MYRGGGYSDRLGIGEEDAMTRVQQNEVGIWQRVCERLLRLGTCLHVEPTGDDRGRMLNLLHPIRTVMPAPRFQKPGIATAVHRRRPEGLFEGQTRFKRASEPLWIFFQQGKMAAVLEAERASGGFFEREFQELRNIVRRMVWPACCGG